jgi:uncharacterized protein YukE
MTAAAKANARVALERNRSALAAMVRDVEDAGARLPIHPSAGWSGPAATAFQCAVARLHAQFQTAQSLLGDAERLTTVALQEVEG